MPKVVVLSRVTQMYFVRSEEGSVVRSEKGSDDATLMSMWGINLDISHPDVLTKNCQVSACTRKRNPDVRLVCEEKLPSQSPEENKPGCEIGL